MPKIIFWVLIVAVSLSSIAVWIRIASLLSRHKDDNRWINKYNRFVELGLISQSFADDEIRTIRARQAQRVKEWYKL